jgi:cytochrome c peroxidase
MGYGSFDQMLERIATKDYYPELIETAFGTAQIDENKVRSALSEFLKSIRSYRNTLDVVLAQLPETSSPWSSQLDPNSVQLPNDQEQRGFELFGELGCANCHGGHDIGGRMTANIGLDMEYADQGVASWSGIDREKGEFRIPSLRNVALTAPYMHDGRFATLEEVIEHYNSNIQAHPNLNWQLQSISNIETFSDLFQSGIDPVDLFLDDEFENIAPVQAIRMNLSESQKQDLLAFLHALTDKAMVSDTRYSNPFVYIE